MSLPPLTARQIAEQTVSLVNVAPYLDAIHAALSATSYTDGSDRTAGIGRAWSSSRTQPGGTTEVLVLSPPAGSGCSARIVLAGFNGARTPLMFGSETYLSNAVHGCVSSNGGALTSWDGTTGSDPLGAGINHTRYVRMSAACTSTGLVCVYETTETVWVMIKIGTSWYGGDLAAIFDPGSDHALDAESDGRGYGIMTSSSSAISAAFESVSNGWTASSSGSGQPKVVMLTPGTGTAVLCTKETQRVSGGAESGKTASGKWVRWPMSFRVVTPGNSVGELRGARRTAQGRARQSVLSAGATSMYLVGGNDAGNCDVLGLMYD